MRLVSSSDCSITETLSLWSPQIVSPDAEKPGASEFFVGSRPKGAENRNAGNMPLPWNLDLHVLP